MLALCLESEVNRGAEPQACHEGKESMKLEANSPYVLGFRTKILPRQTGSFAIRFLGLSTGLGLRSMDG
jgi:hypothetical protein